MPKNTEYTVEKILAHISFRDAYRLTYLNRSLPVYSNKGYDFESEIDEEEHCHYLYLIKWAGYPEFYDCWEPERNFLNDSLLSKYKRKHNLPATHSTFEVENGDMIFMHPLTKENWKRIPRAPLRSGTLLSKMTPNLLRKKSDKKCSSSRDVAPASKNKKFGVTSLTSKVKVKKRQIITSDDEDEVAEPPAKKCLLNASTLVVDNATDRVASHSRSGDTSLATKKVVPHNDVRSGEKEDMMDQPKDYSPATVANKTYFEIFKEPRERTIARNLINLVSPQKYQNGNAVAVKNSSNKFDNQQNVTQELLFKESLNVEPAVLSPCDKMQEIFTGHCPSLEDLFGDNESAVDKCIVEPLLEKCQSSNIHDDQLPASNPQDVSELCASGTYTYTHREYNREAVLKSTLSSRRCTSSEDLLNCCRKEYQIIRKQNRIASFFAGMIKKMKLNTVRKLNPDECLTIDLKKESHSYESCTWKGNNKHMKNMNVVNVNSLQNKAPACVSDESKQLAVVESEIYIDIKREPDLIITSPIRKVTLSGVAPIVMTSAHRFVKLLSSCAQLSQLLQLVIAFLNVNPPQLTVIFREIETHERIVLLKALVDNLLIYLHESSLPNFQPYQYLITAETANSTFTVGSKAPEYCGSGKYPHWKCELLKAILRICPEFCFGDDERAIFPSSSLVHCLQYGSVCLQCLFSSVAPLGIGFADIGQLKVDSNILPLIQNYRQKDFLPLLLQNGFDPNGVITDASEQEIVNISDVMQDLKIDGDKFTLVNQHSRVLHNYAMKRLEFALINHPKLTIDDALTLPHVFRSLGGNDDWIAKYAEICEDSEATTKRILTLNRRIIDECHLSSENILFILSLNPIKMDVSTPDDCDLLLGEPTVPIIVTPARSARCRVKEAMISLQSNSRRSIRFHSLRSLSTGCDQYFIMDFKDKSFLKPGKVDIQVCLEKQDSCGIVAETGDELQSFIVQLFVVSRRP